MKDQDLWQDVIRQCLQYDTGLSENDLLKSINKAPGENSLLPSTVLDLLKLTDKRPILERIDDEIMILVDIYQKEQFISSLSNTKNNYLMNADIIKEIHTLIDNKVPLHEIRDELFHQAYSQQSFNNSDDFLEFILLFKNSKIQWNKEYYLSLVNNKDLNLNTIVYDTPDDSLLVEVLDYPACNKLGPTSWCIVQEKMYYDHYTSYSRRQFIYYDFNKIVEDHESIIGLTVDTRGSVTDSYMRDNSPTPDHLVRGFSFDNLSIMS